METWTAPDIPTLPGRGEVPRLYDTARGEKRQVGGPGQAKLYVCGITPYDATHMGHAATYLAFDLLGRAWRDAGLDVNYVQNVTDIDDPLLERAAATGEDWTQLAEREIALFREDMAALRIVPPRAYIGAVEAIPRIVELIERLKQTGSVYDVEGDLYFSVGTDPRFGQVANLSMPQMLEEFGERGGDPERPGKKDPLDCLLWRLERPGEPAWPSPFGPGRPGWHIECTAIALDHLGAPIDVQGGGSDLAFPHHEMCAAEAHVLNGGASFAEAYVHAGLLAYEGEKMSKSRGNLVFVSKLRNAGVDPMAIRLALMADHYRTDREWTDALLQAATDRLALWRDAALQPYGPNPEPWLAGVRAALADDLDTPAALRAMDTWAATLLGGECDDADSSALFSDVADALLGIKL